MSLTFDDRVKTGNVVSVWAVKLYNSTGAYFGVATSKYDDGQYHYPIIKNKPSIRTSIDLAKSTAKTSDVTLTCINEYLPSKLLSDELFSYNYINQTVKVYQSFDDDNTPTQVQIYTGRLVDISHNHETCTLKIQSARSWDFISIPNNRTSDSGAGSDEINIPIHYGNFTHDYSGDVATYSNDEFLSFGKRLKPCPLFQTASNRYRYAVGETNDSGKGQLFYWDNALGKFVPQTTIVNSTSVSASGTNGAFYYSSWEGVRKRGFSYRSMERDNGMSLGSSYQFSSSSAFSCSHSHTNSVSTTYYKACKFTFPIPSGETSSNKGKYKFDWITAINGYSGTNVMGAYYTTDETTALTSALTSWTQFDSLSKVGLGNVGDSGTLTTPDLPADAKASDIWIGITYATSSGSALFTASITNVRAVGEFEDDSTVEIPRFAYSYDNGFADSWGGGGLCDQINEVHRDILIRYCGVSTTEPEGWTAIQSARGLWLVRYWLLKPESVQKVLERLQYEGGFIFTYTADGSARYIYVKDSYSSNDWTLGDDDLSNIQISHTPFSELETKYIVRFHKHPAMEEYNYEVTDTSGGSTAIRDKYNINAKENIKQVELDALVSSGSSDYDIQEFSDYYFNIFGDIKIIVSGQIVNPAKWGVEVGDIVTFANTSGTPDLGLKAFDTKLGLSDYFMITDLTRSVDSLKFKAREVS